MASDEPRDMWGSDEDRFRNIEGQLEQLTELVNAFAESTASVVQALAEFTVALEKSEPPSTDPEDYIPQEAEARREAFYMLAEEFARDIGYYHERRAEPDLVKLADFLECPRTDLMRIWNAVNTDDLERVPGSWFRKLEAYFAGKDENRDGVPH